MPAPTRFIVGRESEVDRFDDLVAGRTDYWLLNVYGPGGIGKTVVCNRLVTHAEDEGMPVAAVDGIRPDLTSDRLLHAIITELLQGPAGEQMEDAFRSFERHFDDYMIVNTVLQRAGGIQEMFDVVGNVTKQDQLDAVIDELGTNVTTSLKETLYNRFALERFLRNAERDLTGRFVDGVATALEATQHPLTMLIDTYEELESLDDWVCRTLVPELPEGVRLIILGRNQLHKVNFEWSDYGDMVHSMALPELGEEDAKAYLRHYGLNDPVTLDEIYQFTGGYPLLLVLVRHLAAEAGGWEHVGTLESSADRDFVATQLLKRILREERVAEARAFLEKGVIARWFDPEIISVILEVSVDEGRRIYDSLRRHSFVERHPYGLKFHDKIRELLLERLKFESEAEYQRLTNRLMNYYAGKAGIEQERAEAEDAGTKPEESAKYTIHIARAEGIAIGDSACVVQGEVNPSSADSKGVNRTQRCADLRDNMHETLQLIKEYEDERRLADDPKAKRRIERSIKDLRQEYAGYEEEFEKLGCAQRVEDEH